VIWVSQQIFRLRGIKTFRLVTQVDNDYAFHSSGACAKQPCRKSLVVSTLDRIVLAGEP
jgi:hypothetical protein